MDTTARPARGAATGDLPVVRAWAGRLGAPLSEQQLDALRVYRAELLQWNATRANLTALTDPHEIESRLFLESLWRPAALPLPSGARLIDVGSGGGFPGLPLAIAMPQLDVTLIDSTRKKVDFLRHIIGLLNLANCRALHGRAEGLAHEHEHREAYDVVTARALAPLRSLVELCLPFVKVGGALIAPKSADADQETHDAETALRLLGGEAAGVIKPDADTPLPANHRLVVIRKTAPTPDSYPRRAGVPTRRPL